MYFFDVYFVGGDCAGDIVVKTPRKNKNAPRPLAPATYPATSLFGFDKYTTTEIKQMTTQTTKPMPNATKLPSDIFFIVYLCKQRMLKKIKYSWSRS